MPRHSGMADLIVKGAIALITAAVFVGAYLQFQTSFWGALLGALSVYIVLVMLHALMRRSEREKELVYEVNRLEDEVARLKITPQATAAPAATRMPKLAKASPAAAPPLPPLAKAAMPPPAAPAPAAPKLPPFVARPASEAGTKERAPRLMSHRPGMEASEPSLSTRLPGGPSPTLDRATPAEPRLGETRHGETRHADIPAGPTLPDWSAPAAAPAASATDKRLHDYWPSATKPSLAEGPRVELPPLAAERETDLDAVHGMIKRLADEVDVAAEPALDGLPPMRQESALRASLNALQTTANAMRSTKKKSPAVAGGPMPPPIMPSHARLAALAEAISAGRISVALAPIVGLADQQVHYYEVMASPHDQSGAALSTTTRDPQLAVAGLLPLLDGARLRQAARVAATLAEAGRETQLFAPATAVSLANDGFLDDLADVYRDREALAGELVLTFAQADVRTFGGSEWSALTDMRDLGFRFGVEDVTDFDYEFTALCTAGFAFVKMDAVTLLAGLAGPNGSMQADEVCRSLSELGLTLIVCNIDDEITRDRVLAAGVPLGQGALFGAPVVTTNAFAAADDAAA